MYFMILDLEYIQTFSWLSSLLTGLHELVFKLACIIVLQYNNLSERHYRLTQ